MTAIKLINLIEDKEALENQDFPHTIDLSTGIYNDKQII